MSAPTSTTGPDPAGFERPAHADPEIARALPDRLDPAAPMTGATAGLAGRHRDPQTPAPVLCETAQQQRDHRPLKLHRRDIADIVREPALAAAEQRRPDEQNQSAPHQP